MESRIKTMEGGYSGLDGEQIDEQEQIRLLQEFERANAQ